MNRQVLSWVFIACLVAGTKGFGQFSDNLLLSSPPKREFRAAWVATVTNLDWPSSPGGNPQAQRDQLVALLDNLKASGINVIVFQIRTECDALYASPIDPWSYWLTGSQGTAPNPFYDPLSFAVQEAHNRGMELHAWFNPYRAVRVIGSYALAPGHVTVQHPDWAITIGTFKFLDPGLPQVRSYVTSVIMDVVRRYDVDGVHFDDYFYPYPPGNITTQDDSTFAHYPRGFINRADWRRDNVNILIRAIHDSILTTKPNVKFGISPFGIWKSGVPPGITGLDAYSEIYCDAISWIRTASIDYLTPQLYWPFGGGQDYGRLMPWWADSVRFYGRHFYPGEAAYRISAWTSPSEMPNHIRLRRSTSNTGGHVYFRANQGITDNPRGFADSLRTDFYRYTSLLPVMAFKDTIAPYPPRNIRYAQLPGNGPAAIQWDLPLPGTGDTASRYAVYRFDHSPSLPAELDSAKNIIAIEGRRYNTPLVPPNIGGPYYFVATALDRNYNEGVWSSTIIVAPTLAPLLAYPANGAVNQPSALNLGWNAPLLASSYHLQVSLDSTFTGSFVVNDSSVVDTFKTVAGLSGQLVYYWRVRSRNAGGTSGFSSINNFRTGFPVAPQLGVPANYATNVPLATSLTWNRAPGALTYRIQLSTSFDFTVIVKDTTGVVDSSLAVGPLQLATIYFWRVNAINALGASSWSDVWRFRTILTSVEQTPGLPAEFALHQNYPNPFNPLTTVAFSIAEQVSVTLRVYDILGREVATLVNDTLRPGEYRARFDASSLSSGVYFYRLAAGSFVAVKRMSLVR